MVNVAKEFGAMSIISPFRDFIRLYSQILSSGNPSKTFFLLFLGLILGWWLYVPIHELLHAAGCLVGGGEVSRLEIKPLYGGTILCRVFSFVIPESDYAGRLTGFDTHGSDWTYGLTVYFPFLLTLLGFLCLELATRKQNSFVFGMFLPCTFAPLISLTGDFFELGSLSLFHIWPGPEGIHRLLISDDVFRLVRDMGSGAVGVQLDPSGLLFIVISFLIGAALAWGTILLSDGLRQLTVRLTLTPGPEL